ncbi:helix-turn-helix domain-containing protein [Paenibacillus arenilitoris]|uniref:helix-turn-helix domain-containing protein n=1 Tax=Paenibacillus arenilitoris TaxID=2772299 RepID=UPI001CC25281|nr:helix-turn-helix domain-containing protein [Paenibacillus arenilitoris]
MDSIEQTTTTSKIQNPNAILYKTSTLPLINCSKKDICLEVGFQSPSSFSGLFSKRFSMTPSQFRQKK